MIDLSSLELTNWQITNALFAFRPGIVFNVIGTELKILDGGTVPTVEDLKAAHDAYIAEAPARQAAKDLAATDAGMGRVLEDLVASLIALNVITEADLPQSARDKINSRKSLRSQL